MELELPYILDLGDGWDVALVETEEEHDFISSSHKFLRGDNRYFIGGSVTAHFSQNIQGTLKVDYLNYNPRPGGNYFNK